MRYTSAKPPAAASENLYQAKPLMLSTPAMKIGLRDKLTMPHTSRPHSFAVSFQSVSILVLLLMTLVASSLAFGEVYYKWKDENGNWIYGASAPHGVEAIAVNTRSGQNEQTKESASNQETAAGAPSSIDKDMCKRARANLDALNSGAVIQRLDEAGNSVTLSAAEMKEERDKAKAAIDHFCLGFTPK